MGGERVSGEGGERETLPDEGEDSTARTGSLRRGATPGYSAIRANAVVTLDGETGVRIQI